MRKVGRKKRMRCSFQDGKEEIYMEKGKREREGERERETEIVMKK